MSDKDNSPHNIQTSGALARSKRTWLYYTTAAALLAWYFGSSVSAAATKCSGFDELFHLTAGYSYWKLGDFRLHPENGNLPQRWAAIPLLFAKPHFPSLDQDGWRKANVGDIGYQFFYWSENDADTMLLAGRAMTALLGVALATIVFFWTRHLLGDEPALLSLGLFAFCPTMLANGALVTSDMASALFFLASVLCIWRVLHQIEWRTLLVSCIVSGLLFVSKFSAFVVLPIALVLVTMQLISSHSTIITLGAKTWEVQLRRWRLLVHLFTLVAHAVVVWIVIWTFYNFRYDMFAQNLPADAVAGAAQPGQDVDWAEHESAWRLALDTPGAVERSIERMRDAHFLPEAYLYGFADTWRYVQQRMAFLNGNYSTRGWPQFFPFCLLVKTPLTLFVLLGLAMAARIRDWRGHDATWRAKFAAMRNSIYRATPLWTLFIVYSAFAIRSHLNIGHRHLVPLYPPMLMFGGGSCCWLSRQNSFATNHEMTGRWRGWLAARRTPVLATIVMLSTVLFAAESTCRWPNYLAYFNQTIGGPRYAYRHVVDSSLDWGQDLPAVHRWLADHDRHAAPGEKTYLSYFGVGDPEYYGINSTLLPSFMERPAAQIPEPLEAGVYCISATMLQNLYTEFPGHWCVSYEDTYQKLSANVRTFSTRNAVGRGQLIAETGEQFWIQNFRLYEHARLARLVSFLRQREPDAQINYTILIYRLTASELKRAIDGSPVELDNGPGIETLDKS